MKLYKYRTINVKTLLDLYLKTLEERYLGFADIKILNEESGLMIYYDRQKEEEILNTNEAKELISVSLKRNWKLSV